MEAVARSFQHEQVVCSGVLAGPALKLAQRHFVEDFMGPGFGGSAAAQHRSGETVRVSVQPNHSLDRIVLIVHLLPLVMQADGNGSGEYMHSGMRGDPHVGAFRRCSFTKTETTPACFASISRNPP